MTPDTPNKFVICSPLETQLADLWKRWIEVLQPQELINISMNDVFEDEDVCLIAFFGSEQLRQVIHEPRLRSTLKKKVIYHIGGSGDLEISDVSTVSMKAYFGYKDSAPSFLINVEEENLFRDGFLAGLKSLTEGDSLGKALENTRRVWEKLRARKPSSHYDRMVRMFAKSILHKLVLIGDAEWRVSGLPQLIFAMQPALQLEHPRIEVISLSPVLLKWLQEDPARMVKLSAEQFEDLVADRLTKVGLNVTKTGKTFTPDGGIDLIAYPKSSSVPFLLAAQIKHSHTRRPVSAAVVRDFRGAISPLPIDIGVIVTNTTFTPNAEWTARQLPKLIRLRSFEDLKLWLTDEIDESSILKDFPSAIEVAPGLVIPIPWSIK